LILIGGLSHCEEPAWDAEEGARAQTPRDRMPILKNAKHEKFAQLLAQMKSQDAAYAGAGYKPNASHASRLARNGKVKARVAELVAAGAEKAEIDVAEVLAELAKIGFANMMDYRASQRGRAVHRSVEDDARPGRGGSAVHGRGFQGRPRRGCARRPQGDVQASRQARRAGRYRHPPRHVQAGARADRQGRQAAAGAAARASSSMAKCAAARKPADAELDLELHPSRNSRSTRWRPRSSTAAPPAAANRT
jgi:phage terminase small subunit